MSRPTFVQSVLEDRPRTVYLYATSHCNSDCSYCVFRKSNKKMVREWIPFEVIEKVWSESDLLKECGIVVQGGEYALHPEAKQILEFFKYTGHKVTLLTNAVDPQLVFPLYGLADKITISLDSPKHDKIRGAKDNLENIVLMLGELSFVEGVETSLQMTIGPWNASTAGEAIKNFSWFIDMCLKYKCQPRVNVASDDGLLGTAHYTQKIEALSAISNTMTAMSVNSTYKEIAASIKNNLQYILATTARIKGNAKECHSTSIYSTIMANGSVWVCQGLSEKEAIVGNINDQPFDTIWEKAASRRASLVKCKACNLSCQLNGDLSYLKQLNSL